MTTAGPVGPTHPLPSPHVSTDHADADAPEQSSAAQAYLRHIAPFTRPFGKAAVAALIDAAPLPLRHVLDHGSGTGQVARLLHDCVPAATIRCLDPNADLLSAAPCRPLDDWSVTQVGTAADLSPDDQFDGIVSNLVLPFTGDAVDDLAQLRATLLTGCPFVTVTLGSAEQVQPFYAYWDTFRSIEPSCWDPQRYVHFRFGDTTQLETVLAQAGFSTITVTEVSVTRQLTVDAVWEWLSSALPLGRGDGYSPPGHELHGLAQSTFADRFRHKTSWTTQCLMAVATH